LDMEDGAELATRRDLAQRTHRRPEAAVVPDRQQDVRPAAGIEHVACVTAAEREWLFAEHLLAGPCCRDHLRAVQRMRRRQQDRADCGIAEDRVEIARQRNAAFIAKLSRRIEVGFRSEEHTSELQSLAY